MLSLESDRTTEVLVVESALFFTGALIGCIRPRRAWRWAVAVLIAFIIRDTVKFMSDPKFAGSAVYTNVLYSLGDSAPLYLVQCLPVLAGAYLGSLISSAGLR